MIKSDWESRDGAIRLYLGDCLQILPQLEAGSVDAVVTDPPWMDYQTGHYDASGWHKPIHVLEPEAYLPEMARLLRDNSAALVWCRWDSWAKHADACEAVGLSVKNCIVWAKSNHTAGDLEGNMGYMHEMAVFAVKGRWTRPGKREVNLWNVPGLFSRGHRDHPTEKPVALMERSILAICPTNAVVLDAFSGVGPTGVACVRTGRRFIGIEIEPRYFAIAVSRIERALADKAAKLPLGVTA